MTEMTDPYEVYLAYRLGMHPNYTRTAICYIAANLGKDDSSGSISATIKTRMEIENRIEELNLNQRKAVTRPYGTGDTCKG